MKKFKRSCISRSTLHKINSNKYNKITDIKLVSNPDIYDKLPTGWRKKKYAN